VTSALPAASSGREISERRFLTIVFIDLVGYTALSERLDPEDLGKLQRTYQVLALETMERYGGFVARFVGDGILVYFGYPRAHERDAERAVRGSLELLERLRKASVEIEDQTVTAFDARVGIHSGLVVVAQELMSAGASATGIVGEAANLAARLQAEAPPGGIMISSDTLDLVETLTDCESLGMRRFKGLTREVGVYRVRGVKPGARRLPTSFQRGSTRMVGRQEPLETIIARWQSVCSSGQCQTVALVADAGAGKTRLIMEMWDRPELAGALVLQANCHEMFSRTPLYPITTFMGTRAGLNLEDTPEQIKLKVSAVLHEVGMNTPENHEVMLALLGLASPVVGGLVAPTSQVLRRKQYDIVVATIRQLAQRQSTLLWIEDTHWLDPSTAELVQELVVALKEAPVMVLLTMRSFPSGPALPPADEVVRLYKLADRECREIARSVPGAEVLPDDLLDEAVRSAEGVPLFVEQLVISLLDERQQGNVRNRRLGGVPLLLAEMMSERLDRLPGGRRIVQAAACIGRSFVPEFLLAVLEEGAATVAQPLEELVAAELLIPKRYGGEIRYEFRHALLQRMAYESMVQTERRAMHGRVVDVLRQHLATRPTPPEVLAHHLTEAGRTVEAIEAWLQAGANAAARSANVEGIDHLRRGIALLGKVDDLKLRCHLELKLQVTMMGSILATQSATSPELHACCERGLELCGQGDPTPLIFPLAFGKFTYVNCRGNTKEAEQLARMFLTQSERNGFDSGRVIGHRMLGMALMGQARGIEARAEIEASVNLFVPERDSATTAMFGQSTEVHSKSLLSFTLFCLGEVDRALAVGVDALHTADALRHPHSTAIPLVYVGGWLFGLCDATEAMRMESRRLLQLAEQHRLAGFRAHGMGFFGWALCQQGQLAQGVAAIEQAVAAFDAVSFRLAESGHLANLADGQRRLGRMREAETSAARALELVPVGSQWLEAEVLRVSGLIAADTEPNSEKAEALLRRAVDSAQKMGFPVFERRALKSLARHLAPRGRVEDIETRLHQLAHLDDLDRRVQQALHAPRPVGSPSTKQP
jgi:class 3 adenylate cyclase/tetratricopeptide (TPR) repeat protein